MKNFNLYELRRSRVDSSRVLVYLTSRLPSNWDCLWRASPLAVPTEKPSNQLSRLMSIGSAQSAHGSFILDILASAPMTITKLLLAVTLSSAFANATSFLTAKPDDSKAIDLAAPEFSTHHDGLADDAAALQSAIDKAEGNTREGIVFVPSGRYRLARTIYVWPGVRLFGYGPTRPVFTLAPNTPGFQTGHWRHGHLHRLSSPPSTPTQTSVSRSLLPARFLLTPTSPMPTPAPSTPP